MFDLEIKADFKSALAALDKLEKSAIPWAIKRALDATARDVAKSETSRLETIFDKPVPFTRRAYAVQLSTTQNQVSQVKARPRQAEYLGIQDRGGKRTPRNRALLIPQDAKTNQYGNLPRTARKRLLARPGTFEGELNGVRGLWRANPKTRDVDLLIRYADDVSYRPRLGFRVNAVAAVKRFLPRNLAREIVRQLERATLKGH